MVNRVNVLLVCASLLFACSSVSAACNGCCFSFTNPVLPSFILPDTGSLDVTLNPGNSIRLATGDALFQGEGCTGNATEYLGDNGDWTSAYVDANSQTQTSINNIYATQDQLHVSTIQSSQSTLAQILNGRLLRTHITCENGLSSCVTYYLNNSLAASNTAESCNITQDPSVDNSTCLVPLPIPPLCQSSPNPCYDCYYAFTKPILPSFPLPPAGVSDFPLNPDNPIRLSNGVELNPGEGCNGDWAEYLDSQGNWTSNYKDANGKWRNLIDNFYATAQDKLNIRVIQTWQKNLRNVLNLHLVRVNIKCNNEIAGCLTFFVNNSLPHPKEWDVSSSTSLHSWMSWFL